MNWYDGFETIVRPDIPLRDLTWYRLGGPARWLCQPRDEDELVAVLNAIRAAGIPWHVLGGGANVIVRDEGFAGAVIRLCGLAFEQIEIDGVTVRAGAAVDLPKLVRATLKHGLVGLEVLAGIPGTVGGAVRMNAGGRHGELAQFVREVRMVDAAGRICARPAAEMNFAYRHAAVAGCVVTGVLLGLEPGDADEALRRYREIWNAKYATQPPLAARSSGCIFKNPPQRSAGRMLDEAGLKGTRIGGAVISEKHANFIVAGDDATAQDVLNLIQLAKDRVRQTAGIELEPEVEIW